MQSAKFKSFPNVDFFEKLFATIFSIYNRELKEEKALSKTHSTFVAAQEAPMELFGISLFCEIYKQGAPLKRFRYYH